MRQVIKVHCGIWKAEYDVGSSKNSGKELSMTRTVGFPSFDQTSRVPSRFCNISKVEKGWITYHATPEVQSGLVVAWALDHVSSDCID